MELATATPSNTPPLATDPGEVQPPTPTLDYDTATNRAYKAAWSLGLQPDSVRDQIQAGAEDSLRKQISSAWDQKADEQLHQKMSDYSQTAPWGMTSEAMNGLIQQVAREKQFNDPKGVFEWAAASNYINQLYGSAYSLRSPLMTTLLANKPEETNFVSNLGKNYLAQNEFIDTQIENLQSRMKKDSGANRAIDFLLDFIPARQDLLLRRAGNLPFFEGGVGKGSHMEATRLATRRMEFPEFRDSILHAIDYLVNTENSPQTAIKFLQFMKGNVSTYEGDAETLLNTALGVTGGTALGILSRTIGRIAASRLPGKLVEESLNSAVGNIPKAAEASVKTALEDSNPIKRTVDGIYDGFNPIRQKLVDEPSTNHIELRNRTLEEHDAFMTKLRTTVTDAVKIEQVMKLLQTPEGIQLMRTQSAGRYGDEKILGIGEPWYEPQTATPWWETKLGTPKATYFDSEEGATAAANWNGLKTKGTENTTRQLEIQRDMETIEAQLKRLKNLGPRARTGNLDQMWGDLANELYDLRQSPGVNIKNDGLGWYISSWDSLDRESKVARDLFVGTDVSQSPKDSVTDILSALRTTGDTFSKSLFNAARVAAYAPNLLRNLAIDDLKIARGLRGWVGTEKRKEFSQLEDTIRATRKIRNDSGDMGRVFGISELQDFYARSFDRAASDKEVSAYYAWSRYEGLNDALLRLQKLRNEINVDAKMYRVRSTDEQGRSVYSNWFVGQENPSGKRAFPVTQESVLYATIRNGYERIRPGNVFPGKKTIDQAIQEGKIRSVKVMYPHENPLLNYGNLKDPNINISHVVGRFESKPLEITPREFRAWEYDSPYAIKQAITKRDPVSGITYYMGDRTLMNVPHRAAGKQFLDTFNKITEFLRASDEEGAFKYATDHGVQIPWSEISEWYQSGLLDARKDLHLVPQGKRTADIDNRIKDDIINKTDKYKDATLSPHFRQEPDRYEIHEIQNKGSRTQPLWESQPTPRISPLASIDRSFAGIVNSTYLNEFKNMAIQQWIRDARDAQALQYRNPAEVDHSPYHFFYNGQLKGDWPTKSRLEGNRMKIQQILGTPDKIDTALHQVSQNLYDRAYEGGANRLAIIPAWAIDKVPEWSQALRTFAYHAVFSWNPVQIMVQSMNYATIAGLAGYKMAGQGSAAGFFHHFAKRNEAWLPEIGKMMENLGFKPGEFEEAFHALKTTGYQYVGKEHIYNEGMQAKIFSNGAQNFLDFSSMFFNASERNQRYAAWYTAWKEHRIANPTSPISHEDLASILGRADTLTGEMSSASKSMIQRGPLAFTTQFQTYSLRMLELMFGRRIDPVARARTLGTYALLFGVPATAGLVTGLSPVSNQLRQDAIERGYIPGEHWYSTMLNEGIPAYLASLAPGHRVLNVGSRYASFGIDLEGDKSFWDIAGGASASLFKTALDLGSPLIQSMQAMVSEDPETRWSPSISDLTNVLKVWSAYSKGAQLYTALATRDWVSRKGYPLERDISPTSAVFQTFTGLQSQAIADYKPNQNILDAREKAWKDVESKARLEYQNFFGAERDGNNALMESSLKKIFSLLTTTGYPIERRSKLLGEAASSARETLPERQQRMLGTKDLPVKGADVLRERYQRQLEMEGK